MCLPWVPALGRSPSAGMTRLEQPLRGRRRPLQDRLVGFLVARLGIDHVDGLGERARPGRDAQAPAVDVVLDEPAREIAGRLVGEQEIEPKRAQVEVDAGVGELGVGGGVLGLEVGSPVDEHVVALMAPAARGRAGDQHELLVEQVLDGEARRLARLGT